MLHALNPGRGRPKTQRSWRTQRARQWRRRSTRQREKTDVEEATKPVGPPPPNWLDIIRRAGMYGLGAYARFTLNLGHGLTKEKMPALLSCPRPYSFFHYR